MGSYSLLANNAPAGERLSAAQLARKRKIADALEQMQFQQTPVGAGGKYTPFAAIADALRPIIGNYVGGKRGSELDAEETKLGEAEAARRERMASIFDEATKQPALSNQEAVLPSEEMENLAQLSQNYQDLPQQSVAPDDPTGAIVSAMIPEGPGVQGLDAAPIGAGQNYGEFNPRGRDVNVGDLENDQREQMALKGMTPEEQGAFLETRDEFSNLAEMPKTPGQIPPIVQDSGISSVPLKQLVNGNYEMVDEVAGMRKRPTEPVSQMPQQQDTQSMLIDALTANRPQMSVAPPQAPVSASIAPQIPAAPQSSSATDSAMLRLYKEAVRAGDQKMAEFALGRLSPEGKQHVIDGNLIDQSGKVIYSSPKERKLISVAPDNVLFDESSRQQVFRAPGKQEPLTEKVRTLDYALRQQGIMPGSPGYVAAMKQLENTASTHQPSLVDMTQKLETKESQAKGEYNINDYFKPAQEAAAVARKSNQQLTALEGIDFASGWGAEIKAKAAAILEGIGYPSEAAKEYAVDAQTFTAIVKEQVLQKQLAQKGPQTESDAKRMESAFAQMWNTPEANRFIIAVSKAQNNQDIAKAAFLNRYWSDNRTLEGAEDAWVSSPMNKSIFADPSLRKFSPSSEPTATLDVKSKINQSARKSTTFSPPSDLPPGTTYRGKTPDGRNLWIIPGQDKPIVEN
jgi:hypothetical protein